jgi:hypothetical protein
MRSPPRSHADMPEPGTSTPDDSRDQLAREQAALVRAIHDRDASSAPAGFDLSKLQLAGESLWRKRMRSVQKSWPATAIALGARFEEFFECYSAEHPVPDNPSLDGYEFVRWLNGERQLPNAGRIELMQRQVAHGSPVRIAWSRGEALLIGFRWRGAVRIFRK